MSITSNKALIINMIKKHYGFTTDREFAHFLGIKPTTLSSWYARNSFDFELVYAKCKDIDANWLLTGEGKMLKYENALIYKNDFSSKFEKIKESQLVKLYNMEAVAGLFPVFYDKAEVLDYLILPNLPKCDGAFSVRGDSMAPIIEKGDILLFSMINQFEEIIWGQIYLVSFVRGDAKYNIIKYIDKGNNSKNIQLRSNNPSYQPTEITWESIRAIAIIRATVRLNEFN